MKHSIVFAAFLEVFTVFAAAILLVVCLHG
jgi:hypothetical protein